MSWSFSSQARRTILERFRNFVEMFVAVLYRWSRLRTEGVNTMGTATLMDGQIGLYPNVLIHLKLTICKAEYTSAWSRDAGSGPTPRTQPQ